MKTLFNRLAVLFFSWYTKTKGYKFSVVTTAEQSLDADNILREEGYKLPGDLEKQMEAYKKGAIKFIAYHHNRPVGTVGLANPKIANRPFDLHGIDKGCEHFEIQSLIVSKNHRECSQLVLLGLFKEMYNYSVMHSIQSWISLGLKQLYITMRRYNKRIHFVELNTGSHTQPLAAYLYDQRIFDTCAVMNVEDFEPYKIFRKFIKKQMKKVRQNFSII